MTAIIWCVSTGPLALILLGLIPKRAANLNPLWTGRLGVMAGLANVALALGSAITVGFNGAQVTPTLGLSGIGFGIYLDALSVVMFLLVSFIGTITLAYSVRYLEGDANHGAFLKWMALTLGCVLALIISGNLAQLILAWIATSMGLHRLLLFYPQRIAARLAAGKKFIASKMADLCLIIAAGILFHNFRTLDLADLLSAIRHTPSVSVDSVAVLVAIAASLKSAQLPLHGWLTEVMETPTPVSALLHAGIINAGGFLILRLADIMAASTPALEILVIVGATSALFASCAMLTQTSIKVSLAYSTIAQMGFMLLQCGLGAFSAAILHILAHSLYKAHAFLTSGSAIDLARSTWQAGVRTGDTTKARPVWLAGVMALVLSVMTMIGWIFAITPESQPATIALGAIVMMGLVHLIASSIDHRPSVFVISRIVVAAVVITIAYFALQGTSSLLMTGVLPKAPPLRSWFDLFTIMLVIVGFGGVTLFQTLLVQRAETPFWHTAYIHLSHGFYLNTLANRLMVRLWRITRTWNIA